MSERIVYSCGDFEGFGFCPSCKLAAEAKHNDPFACSIQFFWSVIEYGSVPDIAGYGFEFEPWVMPWFRKALEVYWPGEVERFDRLVLLR